MRRWPTSKTEKGQSLLSDFASMSRSVSEPKTKQQVAPRAGPPLLKRFRNSMFKMLFRTTFKWFSPTNNPGETKVHLHICKQQIFSSSRACLCSKDLFPYYNYYIHYYVLITCAVNAQKQMSKN